MRITKSGQRHKTDWDAKDHVAAGHAPTLPPLALAQSNITNAVISLEIAAGCLKRAGKAGAWACVFTALQSLKEAQAAMQEKPKKEVTAEDAQ
jgi:hypothetical protein